jgi:uncharacterized protein YbjT (DUF2867 family)
MKVIITGATGMVGEGVLIECLQNVAVTEVLIVNRKPSPIVHQKLKELLLPDFLKLDGYEEQPSGYDACFYCAGISSVGMDEEKYTHITYDTTLAFAKKLSALNPNMVFTFVSGSHTDINGKQMWQRVKGKTEDDLTKLPFKAAYNFRPGFMKPFAEQRNVKWFFKPVILLFPLVAPKYSLSMAQVGQAMINAVSKGYSKAILEIADIKALATA